MQDHGDKKQSLLLSAQGQREDSVTESAPQNLLPRAQRSRKEDSAEKIAPTAVLATGDPVLGLGKMTVIAS